jgi:hypothetical protein
MRYKKKIVNLPAGFEVGAEIGISGEGHEDFTITGIDRNENGDVIAVHNSSGWREPLSKIYLLRGRSHWDAINDPTSWVDVRIGECDVCGTPFPDSCVWWNDLGPDSMVCRDCHKANGNGPTIQI